MAKIERFFTLILILALSPLFLIIMLVVGLTLGFPVFYIQDRPGKDGVIFRMFKFRTMLDIYDEQGKLLSDQERLTKFGSFLRSTSLDELPELYNVVRAEMSWVGPRPLLKEYLPLYSALQSRRHEVLPGITGWAQVNGRNSISWEEKFLMDVWYVDNHSFFLDMKIILQTIVKVFKREGISQEGHSTMPFFDGSSNKNTDDQI
jgi:lipopolysaccharide/colanic/teichoic acid biosynthesis glycosyltransferase